VLGHTVADFSRYQQNGSASSLVDRPEALRYVVDVDPSSWTEARYFVQAVKVRHSAGGAHKLARSSAITLALLPQPQVGAGHLCSVKSGARRSSLPRSGAALG